MLIFYSGTAEFQEEVKPHTIPSEVPNANSGVIAVNTSLNLSVKPLLEARSLLV